MSLAVLSLLGMLLAVALSLSPRLNAGVAAALLAFLIGVGPGGMKPQQVAGTFPSHMFLTVFALTLLFGHARASGTLGALCALLVRLCRGRVGLLPIGFLFLGTALGTAGPGNIGTVALLAPLGMSAAAQAGIPPFLMALCIASGANSAALSPLSPTGVIAAGLLERAGLGWAGWRCYLSCLLASGVLGLGGYLLLGGARLLRQRGVATAAAAAPLRWGWRQSLTLATIAAVVVAVALRRVDVGGAALAGALLLAVVGASDERAALREVPLPTLIMVCGMMMLVALLERSGGLELVTAALARHTGPRSVFFAIGLLTGAVSAYSSSAGVVLPAFLPMVPGLSARLQVDPLALACAVGVGAHLVDVSPLSTLGALCLANAAPDVDRARLYRQLLAWGLAMAGVGAVYCYLLIGVLRVY